jgi:hypothetical protein
MKRLIFFVIMAMVTLCAGTALAQYGYYGQPAYASPAYYYGQGYNYGGYAPSYYYGSQRGGAYSGQYAGSSYSGSDYSSRYSSGADWQSNSEYEAFKRAHTKADYGKNPPVEIWLGRRIGRIGDYWFEALGGTSKHPTPTGTYTVKAKHEDFYSRKYKAEMPLSVFFTEQCAIHIGSLRVRSHGCIHVDSEAASRIFSYAKVGGTKVRVHD